MFEKLASTDGSLPLSQHRLVSTAQVEEAREVLSRSLTPLRIQRVAENHNFRLDMNGRHLGRFFFGYNEFATNTVVHLEPMEGKVVLALGQDHDRPSYTEIDDERVSVSTCVGVAISSAHYVRNWRPSRSGLFVLSVPESVLAARLQEITGAAFRGSFAFAPSLDLTSGPGRLLRDLAQALTVELRRDGPDAGKNLFQSLLEDALISVVLGLPGNHSDALEEAPVRDLAPRVVRQAEDYLAAHTSDPISLFDLVALCGCSQASLFAAFKTNRGYTPMQYLAARRLELARQRLLHEPEVTVTQVALDCGFGNHGRFAKAYCERFGERPSQTRARRHGPMRF